jgi:hypothetical protein
MGSLVGRVRWVGGGTGLSSVSRKDVTETEGAATFPPCPQHYCSGATNHLRCVVRGGRTLSVPRDTAQLGVIQRLTHRDFSLTVDGRAFQDAPPLRFSSHSGLYELAFRFGAAEVRRRGTCRTFEIGSDN